jgi:CDP-glucose 4,6-dehydratase
MRYGKKKRNGKYGKGTKMSTKKNFWAERNVLVTGASGFLGSYLSEKLVQSNVNVIALVRDNVPKSRLYDQNIYDQITAVRGDVRDYFLLERILNEYEIEVIFHLAAQTIVQIANRSPISTFETNMQGTWNLLEAARKSETVKRIMIVYGEKKQLPYFETDTLNATHPYDLSKAATDMLSQGYFSTYKLPIGITRCGNLYGGGDLNFNRVVPQTIRHLYFNENPIIRSDGTFLRDYFYVEDAVDAYLVFAENLLEKNLEGEAFNFGTEKPISVIDLVNKIIKICGKKNLKPVIENCAKGEIKDQYLSCKKARDILNWKPKHTLNEGLEKTCTWYNNWFARMKK